MPKIIHDGPVALPPIYDMPISVARLKLADLEQALEDVVVQWLKKNGNVPLEIGIRTYDQSSLVFREGTGTISSWDVVVKAEAKTNILKW